MPMTGLNQLLATLKVDANVFHNGQYCGMWAIDTSGAQLMSFHVVTYGQCEVETEGHVLSLNTGDAIFFPSDAKHKVTNHVADHVPPNQVSSTPLNQAPDSDSTGLVCGHFKHQHPMFNQLLAQLPRMIVVRQSNESASSRVIDLILAESLQSGQSTNLLLNKLSDCLLYLLLRDHLDNDRGLLAALTHPKLGKAIDLIHGNTEQRLSVEQLAAASAMSRSAFSSAFKEMVGASPMEYMTQWRMTQAYRWLADDGISTYDAALRCGYESEAAFAKAFKRVMHIGPGQARREYR